MPRTILTIFIYLSASALTSAFFLPKNEGGEKWFMVLPFWLAFSAVPLLFAFAYPRVLIASSMQKDRQRLVLLLNVLVAATTIFLFPRFALPYPANPMRDSDALALLIVPLIALPVFLVAALSLLLKHRSGLATFASVLVWPYWFLFALGTLDHFFWESPLYRVFYFVGFLSPVVFAFAAGQIPYRSTFAHLTAILAGVWSAPWIYLNDVRYPELQNAWIMFNVPDKELGMYSMLLHAKLTILAVALIVLATATAALRLLSPRWKLRNSPLCERTWPAFAASFLVLAIWFSQSVMPYRIPGAVDYADWPILQILHVEKRGLQFHEMSISVWRRGSFSISRNDRRLFQYRFQQKYASGPLPTPLMQRVQAMVQSPNYAKMESDTIKPMHARNADGWYFHSEGTGARSYTTEKATIPPQEIVALFHDLEGTPRSPETQSDRKDVCLGFCYDPISGMGSLYSNQRCFNAGQGTHCR